MSEQVIELTKTSLTNEDLSFLMLSGRNIYNKQGYLGQGIKIAVLDTGADLNHPEIAHAIKESRQFVGYGTNAQDDDGHGTHVCGTIAGLKCGVAPLAEIVPIKVLAPYGGETINIIKALEYVSTRSDIDIVSMSLAMTISLESMKIMLENAIKKCVDRNIAVICAVGNSGDESIYYPGCLQEPITVGAIDKQKNVAYFSTISSEVDVCQVGVNVWSAKLGGGYMTNSGTSMATPIVTGIAALIACKYKVMNGERIAEKSLYDMLKQNTIDLGIKGMDSKTGAGFCTLNQGITEVKLTIGDNHIIIDGKSILMDTKAILDANNRILAPIRPIGEGLGCFVSYDSPTKTATLIG